MVRDRPLAKKISEPAPPKQWTTAIVGNHTGELILEGGRNLGKIDAGEIVLVTPEEMKDHRLIPVTQASLKAARAFR